VNGIKSGFSIFNNPQMRSGEPGELSPKLAIFRGDITTLEVDAIVNAANRQLAGGGGVLVFHDFDVPRILERTGVDGAIHRAAGGELKTESMSLAPCETGQAKITGGYKLPAKCACG
jgi:O-acetyl-ADP-ribose deacetylase (regulator of RNase III)